MIKSNELRCGNLVWDNYGGIYKVVNINSEGFDYIDAVKPSFKAIGRYELENIEPIPLTEDWLVKFGFEDQDWIISHKKTYFNLFRQGDNYFFTSDQHHHNSESIQYVHQLQNLYFALTQTELTPSDGGKIE